MKLKRRDYWGMKIPNFSEIIFLSLPKAIYAQPKYLRLRLYAEISHIKSHLYLISVLEVRYHELLLYQIKEVSLLV
jgi:hypothetical protein